jgi:hypothetical protein
MPTKCDSEQLVSYLYDDLSAEDAAAFERHLRGCAACREELAGFRGLRSTLSTWAPPQPDLAFEVVDTRGPAFPHAHPPAVAHTSWRAWWTPAAGLAAAAVLVLAAASALAHVEIRSGADGFSIRTGWNTTATANAAAQPSAIIASPSTSGDVDLAKFEASFADVQRRLRELEAESHKAAAPSPVRMVSQTGPANHLSDTEILTRVRDLLAQSESRQQRELAIRIAQVVRDVDAQRTADLARIQQGLGRIDAMTTADAAAHRELANYVITSTRQQK